MRQILFTLMMLLAVMWMPCRGQVTARVEISRDIDSDEGRIAPMGEKGVLRYSFLKKKENGKGVYKVMHFDTNLKQVNSDSILVERGMWLSDTLSHNGTYYSLLRDKSDKFAIAAYNPATMELTSVGGKFRKKASMRSLVTDGRHMVFASSEKKLDRLGVIDLSTGECRYVDLHFKGVRDQYIYIMDNVIIDNRIHALVRIGADVALLKMGFDGTGMEQPEILTRSITDHHILTASLSKAGGNYFVTGTYTDKDRGDARKIAQGIYFGQFNGEAVTFIKFYNFFDLKNFTQYMSEKGQEKIERNKEKAEKKGKTFNKEYYIASHDIVRQGDCYYYTGEAYYPVYFTMGGPMGVTQTFEGYRYTHAFIVKFDTQGNVLWDNCFPIQQKRLPKYVKHYVNARYGDNEVNALYVDDNKVVSKTFNAVNGEIIKDRSEEALETDDKDEKVNKSKSTEAEYWYGDNFIIYGDQQVKNEVENKRRQVYYINKLTIK